MKCTCGGNKFEKTITCTIRLPCSPDGKIFWSYAVKSFYRQYKNILEFLMEFGDMDGDDEVHCEKCNRDIARCDVCGKPIWDKEGSYCSKKCENEGKWKP